MTKQKILDQAKFFNQELEMHNKLKGKDDKKKTKEKKEHKKSNSILM